MQQLDFQEAVDEILRVDQRYDAGAYQFVREGLDYTLKLLKKQGHSPARHVRGQELLDGLRQFALEEFGPLAKTVLNHWGVRQCEDLGEIVFNLVEVGVLGKTDEDSRADFKGGFDFDVAFVQPFLPERKTAPHGRDRHDRAAPPSSSPTSRTGGKKKLSGEPG
jgi:uncharacterized repeat protein (TIGR04138 family)